MEDHIPNNEKSGNSDWTTFFELVNTVFGSFVETLVYIRDVTVNTSLLNRAENYCSNLDNIVQLITLNIGEE